MQAIKYFLQMDALLLRLATAVCLALAFGVDAADTDSTTQEMQLPETTQSSQSTTHTGSESSFTDGRELQLLSQPPEGHKSAVTDLRDAELDDMADTDVSSSTIKARHKHVEELFASIWARMQLSYVPSAGPQVWPTTDHVPQEPTALFTPTAKEARRNDYIERKTRELNIALDEWVRAVEKAQEEEKGPLDEKENEVRKTAALQALRDLYLALRTTPSEMSDDFYMAHPFNPKLDPAVLHVKSTPVKNLAPILVAAKIKVREEEKTETNIKSGKATEEDLEKAKKKKEGALNALNKFALRNQVVSKAHLHVIQEVLDSEGSDPLVAHDFAEKKAYWENVLNESKDALNFVTRQRAWLHALKPFTSVLGTIVKAPGKLKGLVQRISHWGAGPQQGDDQQEASPSDLDDLKGEEQ